jgi:hypothetical protein
MTDTFRALCAELVELDQAEPGDYADWRQQWTDAIKRARTALAQAEPQGPSDEELLELLSRASGLPEPDSYIVDGGRIMSEPCEILSFARAVLARWGRPAIEPVAVTERLPGPEDCAPWPDDPDANPWAWAGKKVYGGWEWVQLSMQGLGSDALRIIAGGGWTHWLPHYTLPVPQQQEVE